MGDLIDLLEEQMGEVKSTLQTLALQMQQQSASIAQQMQQQSTSIAQQMLQQSVILTELSKKLGSKGVTQEGETSDGDSVHNEIEETEEKMKLDFDLNSLTKEKEEVSLLTGALFSRLINFQSPPENIHTELSMEERKVKQEPTINQKPLLDLSDPPLPEPLPDSGQPVTTVPRRAPSPRPPDLQDSVDRVRYKDLLDDAYSDLSYRLKSMGDVCAIIYCLECMCDDLSAHLSQRGISCATYHAGLNNKMQTSVLHDWISSKTKVAVVTVAFGMSIDRKDVRIVCPFNISKSMEAFYQESGRAGRDQLPSTSLLYYGVDDRRRMEFILRNSGSKNSQSSGSQEESTRMSLTASNQMVEYCEGSGCRRKIILESFGEQVTTSLCVKTCDSCRHPNLVARNLEDLSAAQIWSTTKNKANYTGIKKYGNNEDYALALEMISLYSQDLPRQWDPGKNNILMGVAEGEHDWRNPLSIYGLLNLVYDRRKFWSLSIWVQLMSNHSVLKESILTHLSSSNLEDKVDFKGVVLIGSDSGGVGELG